MASLTTDPNGFKRIGIETPDEKRHTIRLGDMPLETAEDYRRNIVHLLANWNTPHLVAAKVLEWANKLDNKLYERIARTGLLPSREQVETVTQTLGMLVDAVNKEMKSKKPLTQANYARTFDVMLEHFGKDRPIAAIAPKDADEFITWLRTEKKLGNATVARRIKAYRYLFKRAMRWEMVNRNPFEGIKAGASINHARKVFVPLAEAEKLIEATTDREFRCVLALARYGALRCPSEIVLLRWSDIQWVEGKMLVHSPKTEHHAGGESRMMPLFPRLSEILLDHFEHLPEGASEFVVSERSASKNFRTRLTKLMQRSGIKAWPKLFHAMRASRESELCQEYPLTTVCGWLGHRPEVAAAHYLTDPDKDGSFLRAAGLEKKIGHKATRNPTRSGGKLEEVEGIPPAASMQRSPQNAEFVGFSEYDRCAQRESNPQPSA